MKTVTYQSDEVKIVPRGEPLAFADCGCDAVKDVRPVGDSGWFVCNGCGGNIPPASYTSPAAEPTLLP